MESQKDDLKLLQDAEIKPEVCLGEDDLEGVCGGFRVPVPPRIPNWPKILPGKPGMPKRPSVPLVQKKAN